MGFSLAAVAEILNYYDDPEALSRFLSVKQTEMQEQAEETMQCLRLLETAIKRLRKDNTMMKYDVTLKTLAERYVASVRDIIPAYNQEGMLWNILMQETAPLNLQPADTCLALSIFHDKDCKESDEDVEIQMTVKGTYKNTEHVVFKSVPAVQIASATYSGGYDQLTAVNEAVANWVNDNKYEFDGAMFCIYHVGYAQTQNPDEFVTEVCYPVKEK